MYYSLAEFLFARAHLLEQISYEWEEIRSRAVAVPYFTLTVPVRCD
jgi:hypothetical protein